MGIFFKDGFPVNSVSHGQIRLFFYFDFFNMLDTMRQYMDYAVFGKSSFRLIILAPHVFNSPT